MACRSFFKIPFIIACVILTGYSALYAAAGDPVTAFGAGVVREAFGSGSDQFSAVALQPDGRIVAAGTSFTGSVNEFVVARYYADGSPDPTFGTNGRTSTAVGADDNGAAAVAIDGSGNIVVAGFSYSSPGFYELTIVRYDSSGILDTVFGGSGFVTIASPLGGDATANAVAVDGSGNILAAGSAFNGTNNDFFTVRVATGGALDLAFGDNGTIVQNIDTGDDAVYGIAVQPDGNIIVAGSAYEGTGENFALARYTSAGLPDTTFDTDGLFTLDTAAGFDDGAYSVALQPDGKIVAAGYSDTGIAVVRVDSSGSLDTSFNSSGVVVASPGAGTADARAVALQPDGRIVVAGEGNRSFDSDLAMLSLNADGTPDSGFGENGKLAFSLNKGSESLQALALPGDGGIIAAGASGGDACLVRIEPDGMPDVTFHAVGAVITSIESDAEARAVISTPDGGVIAAGHATSDGTDATLVRYMPDGHIDAKFGYAGFVVADFLPGDSQISDLAYDGEGRLLAAGSVGYDFALIRSFDNGTIDPVFGTGGTVITDIGGQDNLTAIALQGTDIIAAGYTDTVGAILARYFSDGTLDAATFGTSGIVTQTITNYSDVRYMDVAVRTTDIRIAGAGYGYSFMAGTGYDFALMLYNPDGSVDTQFNTGSPLTADFNGEDDRAFAVAFAPDGTMVVAGEATISGTKQFALARYFDNGSPYTAFGGTGRVTTPFGTDDATIEDLVFQLDGKIIAIGTVTDGIQSWFAAARYHDDGTLDSTFGSGGVLTAAIGPDNTDRGHAACLQPNGDLIVAGDSAAGGKKSFALARYQAQELVQADNAYFSDVQLTTANINWTRGNGAACAVFLKQDSVGVPFPENGTTYTANSDFSSATDIGFGWKCVYNGAGNGPLSTGNYVTVTGLTPGQVYRAMVCEYFGSAGSEGYNTSPGMQNPTNSGIMTMAWSAMTSGTTLALSGVWGSSQNDIFAVGGSMDPSAVVLHYDGTSWSPMNIGTESDWLRGVWGTASNDVFAVGDNGTILHYNGTSWSRMTSGTNVQLSAVWGTSWDNVFAVGENGTILRYTGSVWSPPMATPGTDNLFGIWGSSATNIYAVGTNRKTLRYNGTSWTEDTTMPAASVALKDVWGLSETDIFAVGYVNTMVSILRYSGTAWSEFDTSGFQDPQYFNLEGVWGTSGTNVFASGNQSVILNFDGAGWAMMDTGTTGVTFYDVWGLAADDVFAVGTGGTILHYGPMVETTTTSTMMPTTSTTMPPTTTTTSITGTTTTAPTTTTSEPGTTTTSIFSTSTVPVITGHSFLGGSGDDYSGGIAFDFMGNMYVAGSSNVDWPVGTYSDPLQSFHAGMDVFVAKFGAGYMLDWYTFLGGAGDDYCTGLTVDASGYVYITGYSSAGWDNATCGVPVAGYNHSGGGNDVFVAKLYDGGTLDWHSFHGGTGDETSAAIGIDGCTSDIYVAGASNAEFGTPLSAFQGGGADGLLLKCNPDGERLWHTYMGSSTDYDECFGLSLDKDGNPYVAGYGGDWGGTPVNPYGGNTDGFVAKYNVSGTLLWHTFMGSATGNDYCTGVAVGELGVVVAGGYSSQSWGLGTSIVGFGGGARDGFAAKLDSRGGYLWHTFLGGTGDDSVNAVLQEPGGGIYLAGESNATWGSPLTGYEYAGYTDAFAAQLNKGGDRQWNAFMGSTDGYEEGNRAALDRERRLSVLGVTDTGWGSPVNPYAGGSDVFVAAIAPETSVAVDILPPEARDAGAQWNVDGGPWHASGETVAVTPGDHTIYFKDIHKWSQPGELYLTVPENGTIGDAGQYYPDTTGAVRSMFVGGTALDYVRDITLAEDGYMYVLGTSQSSWEYAYMPFNGGPRDVFVAKIDSYGSLMWLSYIGGAGDDAALGSGLAVSPAGDVYVAGRSSAAWGSPVTAWGGQWDTFIARLYSDGTLQWHTFLGAAGLDPDMNSLGGLAFDPMDNCTYIASTSPGTWDFPKRAHSGGNDCFVAKIDVSGTLVWHTFLGSSADDYGKGLALDGAGNVYAAGYSGAEWGDPGSYAGGNDVFAAKISGTDGSLVWNTFLGSSDVDQGGSISVDPAGSACVAGWSMASWGSPITSKNNAGNADGFLARLDTTGSLVWNTFLGAGAGTDSYAGDVTFDAAGSIYTAGWSNGSFGQPRYPYKGGNDIFMAKHTGSGDYVWSGFWGSAGSDEYASSIVVSPAGTEIFAAGWSKDAGWGAPMRSFSGSDDGVIVALDESALGRVPSPVPDTGQTTCYDNASSVPCPTSGQLYFGQDATYDINTPKYTKLDAFGGPLPDNATYWYTVRDEVTGLEWEAKHGKDGYANYADPNDADNMYYNDGTWDNGTMQYIDDLNYTYAYAGHSDWRLPTVQELATIVNSGATSPAVDTLYFENTVSAPSGEYWTNTPYAGAGSYAWFVDFISGAAFQGGTSDRYYVRAVRGGMAAGSGDFVDNGDGTALDINTGLQWQIDTAPGTYVWEGALSYCENLTLGSYNDWRLPTWKELQSIADYAASYPAAGGPFSASTAFDGYWSSTSDTNAPTNAWQLNFEFGSLSAYNKSVSSYVRAVRGGQMDTMGSVAITSFTGAPMNGYAPLTVSFQCEAATDMGTISEYRWDFDGDNVIDSTTAGGSTSFEYAMSGSYNARVVAVNSNGQFAGSQGSVYVMVMENTSTTTTIPPESTTTTTVSESTTTTTAGGSSTTTTVTGPPCPVPDTGQTTCYDSAGTVLDPCPSEGQPFYGQDAQYAINEPKYTKLDDTGVALPDNATYWAMVRDDVTGLVWEVKHGFNSTPDWGDPNDADNVYTWYDGAMGTPGDNGTYDTQQFINDLNLADYGGYSDWRLPTVKELASIVDSSMEYPSVNALYFQGAMSDGYWSAAGYAGDSGQAWLVDFSHGDVGYVSTSQFWHVRAVRSESTCPASSLVDNFDGTVTDTNTGLMWQQNSAPGTYDWQQALSYCDNLTLAGHADWRLPTWKELESIADYNGYAPAVNTSYFTDTQHDYYWASTSCLYDASHAWAVYFFDGSVSGIGYKTDYNYVRAVRQAAAEPASTTTTITETSTTSTIAESTTTTTAAVSSTSTVISTTTAPTTTTSIASTTTMAVSTTTSVPSSSTSSVVIPPTTSTTSVAPTTTSTSVTPTTTTSVATTSTTSPPVSTTTAPASSTTTTAVEIDFTADPVMGQPGLQVTFTVIAQTGSTGFTWDFGDGTTGAGSPIVHTYQDADVYDVTLSLTTSGGATLQKTKVGCITVSAEAPVASFTADPAEGAAPLEVSFADTSTGDITSRTWEFGDGQTADLATVRHTYAAPGQYTALLRVKGEAGTSSATQVITVTAGSAGHEIAGLITGDAQAGIDVSLTGEDFNATMRTGTDGMYSFPDIPSGLYRVTPLLTGYVFDPPGAEVRLRRSDVTQDFTATAEGPTVTQATAAPGRAPADGATEVTLSASVSHPLGQGAVGSVTADLTAIGGAASAAMRDDGTQGDAAAGDGVYTLVTTVTDDTEAGIKALGITATDADGATRTAFASLDVYRQYSGSLGTGGTKQYQVKNAVTGQTLQFVLTQTVGGASSSAQVEPGRQAVDCAPNMVVISPSGVESSSQADTASQTTVEVPDAEAGTWTCSVANPCETTVGYELESSISGTGLVSGLVVDAATGTGLDGVSLATTAGIGRDSEQGVFVMVHPAGSYSLSAGMAGYMTARKTLTVSAGGSAEMNIALSAGSDSTGCLLQSALGEGAKLERLRRFRDRVLSSSAPGRRYRKLYYRHSPEILSLVRGDRTLAREMSRCIIELFPLVEKMLAGQEAVPDAAQRGLLLDCLETLRARATPALAAAIDDVLQALNQHHSLQRMLQ